MNDEKLDSRAKPGRNDLEPSPKSGFIELLPRQFAQLKRIIAGMGVGGHDSEDVLQDVSVQALKCAKDYRDPEQARRWLIKVTINCCLTMHRRRRTFIRSFERILKRQRLINRPVETADKKVINAEELEIVRKSLRKLDKSLLPGLVLKYFCDLNSNQIGEILNISPSTVRSRLRQARLAMAKSLVEKGIES